LVVSSITSERQQNLLLGLSLAVVDVFLELWASLVKEVVIRVHLSIVTWSRVISLIPALVSKVRRNISVSEVGEDVDESNRNDIDTGRITEMRQRFLVWS